MGTRRCEGLLDLVDREPPLATDPFPDQHMIPSVKGHFVQENDTACDSGFGHGESQGTRRLGPQLHAFALFLGAHESDAVRTATAESPEVGGPGLGLAALHTARMINMN